MLLTRKASKLYRHISVANKKMEKYIPSNTENNWFQIKPTTIITTTTTQTGFFPHGTNIVVGDTISQLDRYMDNCKVFFVFT